MLQIFNLQSCCFLELNFREDLSLYITCGSSRITDSRFKVVSVHVTVRSRGTEYVTIYISRSMLISSLSSVRRIEVLFSFSSTWKIAQSSCPLILYSTNVLPAHSIPCGHVLFHTLRETAFFFFRQAASGRRNALFEAAQVDFLKDNWSTGMFCIWVGLKERDVLR